MSKKNKNHKSRINLPQTVAVVGWPASEEHDDDGDGHLECSCACAPQDPYTASAHFICKVLIIMKITTFNFKVAAAPISL